MNDTSKIVRLLFPALAVVLLLASWDQAGAAWRQAVTLKSFVGIREGDAVRLRWETGTEIDVVGFKMKRATSASGPFTLLTNIGSGGIVLATGSGLGDTYEVVDDSANQDNSYWYTLLEVTGSNEEIEVATIAVAPAQQNATATPTAAGSEPDPGQGTDPTPTAVISAAPAHTETPTPASPSGGASAATATATRPPTRIAQEAPDTAPTATNTGGARMVEAADDPQPTEDAQATINPQAPTAAAVAQATEAYPAGPAGEDNPVDDSSDPANAYPADESLPQELVPGADVPPTAVGIGADALELESDETAVDEAEERNAQAEEGLTGRILLWIGFIGALLIFVVGVFFSIFLSMRHRDNTSP
ncbi:MAG: hypothetical protein R3272_13825 [Candidatus Promineifilaceae bacterium]|nr:hypothetical protein [Candidatus Promineifilaceae bacterium]